MALAILSRLGGRSGTSANRSGHVSTTKALIDGDITAASTTCLTATSAGGVEPHRRLREEGPKLLRPGGRASIGPCSKPRSAIRDRAFDARSRPARSKPTMRRGADPTGGDHVIPAGAAPSASNARSTKDAASCQSVAERGLVEAATICFSTSAHSMAGVATIAVMTVPNESLRSNNDRLARAGAKKSRSERRVQNNGGRAVNE